MVVVLMWCDDGDDDADADGEDDEDDDNDNDVETDDDGDGDDGDDDDDDQDHDDNDDDYENDDDDDVYNGGVYVAYLLILPSPAKLTIYITVERMSRFCLNCQIALTAHQPGTRPLATPTIENLL